MKAAKKMIKDAATVPNLPRGVWRYVASRLRFRILRIANDKLRRRLESLLRKPIHIRLLNTDFP
jgi:hypothetical protein